MPQLYRGEEISPFIHPIDVPGWLNQGWSETPTIADEESRPTRGADESVLDRKNQLEAMDWRELKAIAEPLGIEKPEGGWDESIPFILAAEETANADS